MGVGGNGWLKGVAKTNSWVASSFDEAEMRGFSRALVEVAAMSRDRKEWPLRLGRVPLMKVVFLGGRGKGRIDGCQLHHRVYGTGCPATDPRHSSLVLSLGMKIAWWLGWWCTSYSLGVVISATVRCEERETRFC